MKQKVIVSFRAKTKKELATAIFSLGNFVGGSIVLGQFFGNNTQFQWEFVGGGILLTGVLYSLAIITMEL